MPDGLSGGGGSGSKGAGVASNLSMLLQELARAPGDDLHQAWQKRLQPGDAVGRFEILREIGRGGFGVVYEALDRQLGRSVAFKTLRPVRTGHELSADWILKEAEAVARLDHPAIVTLYDVGHCESGPYLVEEMLRGETLEQRLRSGPLLAGEAVAIGLEVAKGLGHAHRRGVLHRDLKPGNVFLTEDGQVKLLDFGLAHLLGTRELHGAGTPAYMAPEQLRGEAVDARADVFALGATLFQGLAGKPPFEVNDGRSAALDEGPAPALPGSVPALLSPLLERCLSRDPSKRPAGGQAVAEELLAVQRALDRAGQELGAAPAGALAPRRNLRLPLALAGAALVVAGGVYLLATRGRSAFDSAGPAAASPTLPSVAVLPFADMSPGKDQEYFADGVAEEILNALTQVEGLRVIGRTSSFSFKGTNRKTAEIGRELNVGTLLEGSVRKAGSRIRIAAQLVRASDGSHLWAQTFDRELADVFAIQDEISRAVVEALRVRLVAGRTLVRDGVTSSPEAFNQYLLGRDLLRSGNIEDAKRALRAHSQAVSVDARFAPAWAGVALAITWLESMAGEGTSPEQRRRALAAAEKAIELAPQLPDGYIARGRVRRSFFYDWRGALADLERARSVGLGESDAALYSGMVLLALGDLTQALVELEHGTSIDPLSPYAWSYLGLARVSSLDHERGRAALERALQISPGMDYARWVLYADLASTGRPEAALAVAEQAKLPWVRLTGVSIAQHALGHPRESRAALEALVAGNAADGAYQIAEVHAWRGESDLAFEWLQRARAQGDPGMFWLKNDPLLRKLHDDPRWKPFLRKMNLPVD